MMSEYVPEPEIFKPERWLRTADSTILASPYLTMAFGVGPRMCLGKRLAELQINIGIIKVRIYNNENLSNELCSKRS